MPHIASRLFVVAARTEILGEAVAPAVERRGQRQGIAAAQRDRRMPLPGIAHPLQPDQGELGRLPVAAGRALLVGDHDRRPAAALPDPALQGPPDLLAVDLEVIGDVVEICHQHQIRPRGAARSESSSSVIRASSGPVWARTLAVAYRTLPPRSICTGSSSPSSNSSAERARMTSPARSTTSNTSCRASPSTTRTRGGEVSLCSAGRPDTPSGYHGPRRRLKHVALPGPSISERAGLTSRPADAQACREATRRRGDRRTVALADPQWSVSARIEIAAGARAVQAAAREQSFAA